MESGAHGETRQAGTVGAFSPAVLRDEGLAALRALTILRLGRPADDTRIGSEAIFYPLVGLGIGAILWALDSMLRVVLNQEATSVLLVAALAVLSAGRHLDGFGNTADGLIGMRRREDALATMRDRPLGTFGTAAIFFLLVLKIRSFDLLADEARVLALLIAPMLGRWAMIVLAHGAREAGPVDEVRKFARGIAWREFAVASVVAFGVALILADAAGLIAVIAAALATVGLRIYLHRRLGGITNESLGAACETVEALVLVLFGFGS